MHTTCPRQVTIIEATPGALIHPTPLGGREDIYPHFTDAETEAQSERRTQPKKGRRVPPAPGFREVTWGLLSQQTTDRPRRPWECPPRTLQSLPSCDGGNGCMGPGRRRLRSQEHPEATCLRERGLKVPQAPGVIQL